MPVSIEKMKFLISNQFQTLIQTLFQQFVYNLLLFCYSFAIRLNDSQHS